MIGGGVDGRVWGGAEGVLGASADDLAEVIDGPGVGVTRGGERAEVVGSGVETGIGRGAESAKGPGEWAISSGHLALVVNGMSGADDAVGGAQVVEGAVEGLIRAGAKGAGEVGDTGIVVSDVCPADDLSEVIDVLCEAVAARVEVSEVEQGIRRGGARLVRWQGGESECK